MTDKIVLADVAGTYDVTNINANFQAIGDLLNNLVLTRDDVGTIKSNVDMNGFRIVNLPKPTSPNEAARFGDIVDPDLLQSIAAQAEASAAKAAAVSASLNDISTTVDAVNAAKNTTVAAKDTAVNAASNLTTAVATATQKATDATTQAGVATTKAGEAAASATAASTSAGTASQKASDAAASAQQAADSAAAATGAVVKSVAGKTGDVSLVKGDVGLGNVDNTSDVNKPVSTAQQTALNAKVDTSSRTAANGVVALNASRNAVLPNVAGTFNSVVTNTNTAARTYTLPDKDGTVAMIADTGAMVLLAQATTASAVANVDFLTTFSSTYDKYVIEISNALPATLGSALQMRFAKAGVVDTASLYIVAGSAGSGTVGADSQPVINISGNTSTVVNATCDVRNANSTTIKGTSVRSMYQGTPGDGTTWAQQAVEWGYRGTTTITGFRLFWSSGNFTTGTVVRVYGIKNS